MVLDITKIQITTSDNYYEIYKNKLKSKIYPICGWCTEYSDNYYVISLTKLTNEKNILKVLNHEIMHCVLREIKEFKANKKFNNIDGIKNGIYPSSVKDFEHIKI